MIRTLACQPYEAERYARWLKRDGIVVVRTSCQYKTVVAYPFKRELRGHHITDAREIVVETKAVHLICDIAGQDIQACIHAAKATCEEYCAKTGTIFHFSIDTENAEIVLYSHLKYVPLLEYLKSNHH